MPAVASFGPRAVRSLSWPWGYPWLQGCWRRKADKDNRQLRSALSQLKSGMREDRETAVAFADVEDLGSTRFITPASIWQLAEVREMAKVNGWCRAAFFQCSLSPLPTRRPTGILTSSRLMTGFTYGGWPKILRQGRDFKYHGPLPAAYSCAAPHYDLRRRAEDRTFRTRGLFLSPATVELLTLHLLAESIGVNLRRGLLRWGKTALASQVVDEDADEDFTEPEPSSDAESPEDIGYTAGAQEDSHD